MTENKLLPISTIILLKGGNKKLCIYGRKQIQLSTNKIYDYIGCLYPEGYIDVDNSYLFQHEDIDTVVHMGFHNYEEIEFQTVLASIEN
jgi:hypothetical protein